MNIRRTWIGLLVAGAACASVQFAVAEAPATEPQRRTLPPSVLRALADTEDVGATASMDYQSVPRALTDIVPHGGAGRIAGTAPGTNVYRNEIEGAGTYYSPGAGERMADDLQLAAGACSVAYYNLAVFSDTGTAPFDVDVALWDGDPCLAGSSLIAGTDVTFTNVAVAEPQLLEYFLEAPVSAPGTVWLAATFSTSDAGWIIADEPELGSSNNVWSEDHSTPVPPNPSCGLFWFNGERYAAFWANVNCDLAVEPSGACCDGATCTEITAAECTAGTWLGAFTDCTPDPCAAGACCTGGAFRTCADSTAVDCPNGFFNNIGGECGVDACGPNHIGYANLFNAGFYFGIDDNVLFADDVDVVLDAPCDLFGVEALVSGGGSGAPSTYAVEVSLWTNNDNATPNNPNDDRPGSPIPGASATTDGIPADALPHAVRVTTPATAIITGRIWVVIDTDTSFAGPLLGGPAKIGHSLDSFALYNDPDTPNAWAPGWFFGGANPLAGCPDPDTGVFDPAGICPAGSARIRAFCKGDAPTGACCDDKADTCTDGVERLACPGRWAVGATCAGNPFSPPCGNGACCFPNPINPNVAACVEESETECSGRAGDFSPGMGCPGSGAIAALAACPAVACLGQEGECFANNGSPGCEDAFCCDRVCALDDFCCLSVWDEVCVGLAEDACSANDSVDTPTIIDGEGIFPYDTTTATIDGPTHRECANFGDEVTDHDVWYCWTSPCTDVVLIDDCVVPHDGPEFVDTKLAAYEGCTNPEDASLLTCADDSCGFQARTVFEAQSGAEYLVRVGTFPDTPGGVGELSISCGVPGCPGDGDCCGDTGTPGCTDPLCCAKVCACDSFCCESEWDSFCAGFGFNGNGCGAAALCGDTCGGTECPIPSGAGSAVAAVDPPNDVVDAGRPHDRDNTAALSGIDMLDVAGPIGAGATDCWSLCETESGTSANAIVDVIDNGGGLYSLVLNRPLTAGAVTTISYTGDATVLSYTAQPGNVNGDARATVADVQALIDILDGTIVTPVWGHHSADIDRSGVIAPGDLLELIDLDNGAGTFDPWLNTTKPTADGICP